MNKLGLLIIALSLLLLSCSSPQPEKETVKLKLNSGSIGLDESALLADAQTYFSSIDASKGLTNPKEELGKRLYYETALSVNDEMSCNSCHDLKTYGVDNEPTSPGHEDKRGDRNSPTVYNAGLHIAQFWDGRAEDLKAQAKGPILNPIEMGIPDEATAVAKIKAIDDYAPQFKAAFKSSNAITYDNIAEAIAEFEKTLTTPSRFDSYLNGNKKALYLEEKEGLRNFINTGCITCHVGPAIGGDRYHKFGLLNGPYWNFTKSENQDEGRFAVTGKEADKQWFKVPSLRNIAKTGPYFHDGSVDDLNEAVKIMAKTQLDKSLTEKEISSIVAFLESLTGDIPKHALN